MYARPMYNITLANEYLRSSTDEAVASHGITGADAERYQKFKGGSAVPARF